MPSWAKAVVGLVGACVLWLVLNNFIWESGGRCFVVGPVVRSPTGRFEAELMACGKTPETLEVQVSVGAVEDDGRVHSGALVFTEKTPVDQATFDQFPGDNRVRTLGTAELTWLDASHLQISVPAGPRWERGGFDSYNGVSVTYKETAQ